MWLEWEKLPFSGYRARLSRLTRWVLDLARAGHAADCACRRRHPARYRTDPSGQCLTALALFKT
jgi:hypothetical protein